MMSLSLPFRQEQSSHDGNKIAPTSDDDFPVALQGKYFLYLPEIMISETTV
jgi:hypothetical protein